MRKYAEEAIDDWGFKHIKDYILSLKNYSKEDLLNEIVKNHVNIYKNECSKTWAKEYKDTFKHESTIDLVARALEEKHYIFNDDEEHRWNVIVVNNIITNTPVKNRWTNESYW